MYEEIKIPAIVSFWLLMMIFGLIPICVTKLHKLKVFITLTNCFTAGIFIAMSIVHILPEANEAVEKGKAASGTGHDDHDHHNHRILAEDAHAEEGGHSHGISIAHLSFLLAFTLIFFIEKVVLNRNYKKKSDQEKNEEKNKENTINKTSVNEIKNDNDFTIKTDKNEGPNNVITQPQNSNQALLESNQIALESQINEKNGQNVEQEGLNNTKTIEKTGKDHQNETKNDKKDSHGHGHDHDHLKISNNSSIVSIIVILFALSIHTFLETLAVGLENNKDSLIALIVAIAFHRWSEGLAIGTILVKKKFSKLKSTFIVVFVAIFTPLGGIKEQNFKVVDGINHTEGEDCEFINLKIHNVPGSGIGSWKRTGGSVIKNCRIFNNGYFSKVRGSGVGIYVQNQSDKTRLIENNLVFNNYYKGIEVWSASSGSDFEYIKNITLKNNVVFNNGLPANVHVDNVIIASGDTKGVNLPQNIKLLDNILYHNVDFASKSNFGDGATLTLGLNKNAPVKQTIVENNILIGKNNALRILHANSLTFKNNKVYCGYVHFYDSVLNSLQNGLWSFQNNAYYSRTKNAFRIVGDKDYNLKTWQTVFNIDGNSSRTHVSKIDLAGTSKLIPLGDDSYYTAFFKNDDESNELKISTLKVPSETAYSLMNIETDKVIIAGKVDSLQKIKIPQKAYNGIANNFAVYKLVLNKEKSSPKEKKNSFFKRIFGWLF